MNNPSVIARPVRNRQGKGQSSGWNLLREDEPERIFDRGPGGYKGNHLKKGELGKWLAKLEAGHVKPDAKGRMPVLVYEAVDRLTRMGGFQSIDLIRRIIDSGCALAFESGNMWVDSSTIQDHWIMLNVLIDMAHSNT